MSQPAMQKKPLQCPIRAAGFVSGHFSIQFIWVTGLIELRLACLADANSDSARLIFLQGKYYIYFLLISSEG